MRPASRNKTLHAPRTTKGEAYTQVLFDKFWRGFMKEIQYRCSNHSELDFLDDVHHPNSSYAHFLRAWEKAAKLLFTTMVQAKKNTHSSPGTQTVRFSFCGSKTENPLQANTLKSKEPELAAPHVQRLSGGHRWPWHMNPI